MDLGLEGKVALVGGGSRGLGRATAEYLAQEGMELAIYARGASIEDAAREISARYGVRVHAIRADVREPADCERAVAETVRELGGLDALVTNMASDVHELEMPETDEGWLEEWQLYTMSVIRLTRHAVPPMRARGRASIINMSSCGVHQIVPRFAPSEIPRLATTGFAKYMATKLAPEAIRVNNVLPGYIANDRTEHEIEEEARERSVPVEQVFDEWSSGIPMGRWGDQRDVATLVAFLASDVSKYITGTNIRVDGGWCLAPTY